MSASSNPVTLLVKEVASLIQNTNVRIILAQEEYKNYKSISAADLLAGINSPGARRDSNTERNVGQIVEQFSIDDRRTLILILERFREERTKDSGERTNGWETVKYEQQYLNYLVLQFCRFFADEFLSAAPETDLSDWNFWLEKYPYRPNEIESFARFKGFHELQPTFAYDENDNLYSTYLKRKNKALQQQKPRSSSDQALEYQLDSLAKEKYVDIIVRKKNGKR